MNGFSEHILHIFSANTKDKRTQPCAKSAVCAVALLALVMLAVRRVDAQTVVPPRPQYSSIASALSGFIQHEMEDKQLPAVSIALVDDQEIVWAQGFGVIDSKTKGAAKADTVYRVGSVSKLFTDIAIMQQVERHRLDLDAPATEYLPEFQPHNPFGNLPITLRELMAHRAGLLREPPVGHYFDPTEPTLEATVRSLGRTTLVYPPGLRTKYSNGGIAAGGYILERLANRPYASVVNDAVLRPMGLSSSAFELTPQLSHKLAKAYIQTYHGRTLDAPTFQLGTIPAGSMYSTVLDLGHFISVLLAGGRTSRTQILQPGSLEQMWTPQFPENGSATFGLGFRLSSFNGQRMVGHGGAIYGFATELDVLPDAKLGAVVITTLDSANAVAAHIAGEALRMALAQRSHQPVIPPVVSGPIVPALSRRLAGRYGTGDDAVDLTEEEGRLFILPVRGGYKCRLRRLGDELIVDDKLSYGQRIQIGQAGILAGGNLLQKQQEKRPSPTNEVWRGLIGEYGWDHDVLLILERDGKLTSLIEWYEFEPLEQVSGDRYKYPTRGLYDGEDVVFTRDSNGFATQVKVGEVVFKRRHLGSEDGSIFRIVPLKPIDKLRKAALQAKPPVEQETFKSSDLVEVTKLDRTIKLDIRYATNGNFISTAIYQEPRAFLQRPAAEALVRVNQALKQHGFGLLIHDAYRPWYVTKIFWEATPPDKRIFVADPATGSRHNRGCAVDLTLYDLNTGDPVQMASVYDEMTDRSFPFYPAGTSLQRWQRDLLREQMEAQGYRVYETEWWHFDYKNWQEYRIGNTPFAQLGVTIHNSSQWSKK